MIQDHSSKSGRQVFNSGQGNVVAQEFEFNGASMNAAIITLTAPYPDAGNYALNKKSEMLVLVLDGGVTLVTRANTIDVARNDVVHIPSGAEYRWNPLGTVTLYIVSSPPWNKDQQFLIEE